MVRGVLLKRPHGWCLAQRTGETLNLTQNLSPRTPLLGGVMIQVETDPATSRNQPVADSVAGFLAPRRSTPRETVLGWALVAGPGALAITIGALVLGVRLSRDKRR